MQKGSPDARRARARRSAARVAAGRGGAAARRERGGAARSRRRRRGRRAPAAGRRKGPAGRSRRRPAAGGAAPRRRQGIRRTAPPPARRRDLAAQQLAEDARRARRGMRDGEDRARCRARGTAARRGARQGRAQDERRRRRRRQGRRAAARRRSSTSSATPANASRGSRSKSPTRSRPRRAGRGRDSAPDARAGRTRKRRAGQQAQAPAGDGQGAAISRSCSRNTTRSSSGRASSWIACSAALRESGGRMSTPEQHEWSRSAPGTEAFKQDYADVAVARGRRRRRRSSAPKPRVAGRLSSAIAKDRLRAGGSERVPDAYRDARVEVLRVDRDQEEVTFANPLPPWALLAVAGAAVVVAWLAYRRVPIAAPRRYGLVGAAPRTLLWLVVCLMRPMVARHRRCAARRHRPDPRRRLAEHGAGGRRWGAPDRPRARAGRAASLLPALSPRFHAEVLRFGDRVIAPRTRRAWPRRIGAPSLAPRCRRSAIAIAAVPWPASSC